MRKTNKASDTGIVNPLWSGSLRSECEKVAYIWHQRTTIDKQIDTNLQKKFAQLSKSHWVLS